MKHFKGTKLALALLLGLLVALPALAQGGGYSLDWFTVDGGGGESTGSAYSLSGAIGQADAGALSGSGYTLNGGFWSVAGGAPNTYLPLIMK